MKPIETIYTAVPTGNATTTNNENLLVEGAPLSSKKSSRWKLVLIMFAMFGIFGFLVDEGEFSRKGTRGACKRWPWHKKSASTLTAGGGRDWVINAEDGTIAAKHEAELVLGSTPYSSLILVEKGSPNQIVFDTESLEDLSSGKTVDLKGIGLQYPDLVDTPKSVSGWYYDETSSNKDSSVTVSYKDENFILLEQGVHKMVLDVSFWKMVEGNTVNFVGAAEEDYTEKSWHKKKWWDYMKMNHETFLAGGGRDWTINVNDGTISAKHSPDLVLGIGTRKLLLVNKDSSGKFVFENLEDLATGESVPLIAKSGDEEIAVGKMYEEEKLFGPWHYIESAIVPVDKAVSVKYIDKNFLSLVEEEDDDENTMVLDISFWKMVEGNTVNFVRGKVYKD